MRQPAQTHVRCTHADTPAHAATHPPPHPADLCTIKDQKQLQKPLKNQWAVVLVPIPPAALTKPPAKQQQQQQQQTAAQQDKQPEADAQEEEGAAGAPHVQAAAAQ